jgi:selenocysteine-specific elongation factor
MGEARGGPSRLVIGTAGHVDHGKTSLVRALTGIDTDRLPEEKSRGISIELGFAPLDLPDGRRAALVDVPGHERFLHTMVSGVTGVDLVLLVIAADEGVMPQTREHLDVCALLGLRRGVVALTKIDAVDAQLRALAVDDARAALRGSFLEGAPLVPCSSVSGEGLEALRAALVRATADLPTRPSDGPGRLPVDRVFSVKGSGLVVTGTVASGRLESGAAVAVLPGGAAARVRAIEVHGEKRQAALAGERAALNLAGVERDDVRRGLTIVAGAEVAAPAVVEVELRWLPICPAPLRRRARLLFHALTTQENALVELIGAEALAPGKTGFARVRLERGVALLPGDRFVLRGFRTLPGHGTTVGGGRVLRVVGSSRRDPQAHGRLVQLAAASDEERALLEIRAAGAAGIPRPALPARTGLGAAALERACARLLSRRQVMLLGREPGQLVAASELERMEKTVLDRFQALHDPALGGVAREALRTSAPALARLDPRVFAAILERLAEAGRVESAAELVRRPGAAAPAAPSDLEGRVAGALADAGLAPPLPAELAAALALDPGRLTPVLDSLVKRGEVVRVGRTLFFARRPLDEVRDRLRAFLVENGSITTQQMKSLVGGSRKYAIPLAEHFDAEKLTLRVGELRRLRAR